MKSRIFDDILSRGRNISTEFYPIPGSFKAFEPQTPVIAFVKRKECHMTMTKQGAGGGRVLTVK